jgi:hypothetical protein
MAKIRLKKFGNIDEALLEKILRIMDESYKHLGEPIGGEVDLHAYEKASTMHILQTDEEENLGIKTSSLGESFPITHDAWAGRPRIRVSMDRISEYPEDVTTGGIRHVIAHSILHGSPNFYKIPEGSAKTIAQYGFTQDYAATLLYLLSIDVKSYEASNLLYSKDFTEDQIAYTKYFLKPSEEDILAWKIGSQNPLGRILCSVSIKDITYAIPLSNDKKIGDEIKKHIEERIAIFSSDYKEKIRKIAYDTFPSLHDKTMENINFVTKAIAKEVIEYELG